ncbi:MULTISPECIES: HEPN domain-containing protein [unclassified Nitratiruptor]|uniref:HEPN domain-containing protein n=1 Tax=unclassified Nitratiruptor TaxID=2624044 RepID=UPI0019151EE9|nr:MULTISPECIES: HEPN domain-containing protein [unclassified Nitratiruptor]BCD60680.1 hypothetical protein NitYY0810_C1456 [Nitratiruptor sp. YY08-10]BCD64611.1 hypothetical protein NitYY0814_C1463 [Nitratiruptor sp. YY08-14]
MGQNVAQEWLNAAQDDILVIEEIISNPHLTHMVAFHAQQAIEKCLKAYLEAKKMEVPKIHKLETLFQRTDIPYDQETIELLDALYIEARYPGDLGLLPTGKPSLEEAKRFYQYAKNTLQTISQRIHS